MSWNWITSRLVPAARCVLHGALDFLVGPSPVPRCGLGAPFRPPQVAQSRVCVMTLYIPGCVASTAFYGPECVASGCQPVCGAHRRRNAPPACPMACPAHLFPSCACAGGAGRGCTCWCPRCAARSPGRRRWQTESPFSMKPSWRRGAMRPGTARHALWQRDLQQARGPTRPGLAPGLASPPPTVPGPAGATAFITRSKTSHPTLPAYFCE